MMAKCPAHDDHNPSLSIDEGAEGKILLKCWSGCVLEDVLRAAQLTIQDLFQPRIVEISNRIAVSGNGEKPRGKRFDWDNCIDALSETAMIGMAKSRGFSMDFVNELKTLRMIGLHNDHFAVPVHEAGCVIGVQYRIKEDHSWRYYPEGIKSHVWQVGLLNAEDPVDIFESNFDALSFMEKSGYRDNILITRGTANAKAAAALVPKGAVARLWTQNDTPGSKWQADFCGAAQCIVKRVKIPIVFKDFNQWMLDEEPAPGELMDAIKAAETLETPAPPKPLIEFCSQYDLEHYTPPEGITLIGDYHIVKDTGFVFVIGGPPGCGKSLSIISLAVAGANGEGEWFGMKVHRKFKVMIVQTENGLFRLSRNFKDLSGKNLQDHMRISKPPPYGLAFRQEDFRHAIADCIREFEPDIVVIDPWNAAARDQEQSTYLETFQLIRSVLPVDTVLGIVAHTRKPQTEQRSSGRALMHLLAGSYILSSCPRSIFVLQYASDDTEDDQVVWTCCKNNDGELGPRTAWKRKVGLFESVSDFDWEGFDSFAQDKRFKISKSMVELVFSGGEMLLADAVDKLADVSKSTEGACYKALSKEGRFSDHLVFKGKFVNWLR